MSAKRHALPGRPAEQLSGVAQVQRVYLVEVTDMESYSLNLETVFMLDRATRKLSRCAVERAPGVTEDSDNVLRITCACCLLISLLQVVLLQVFLLQVVL